jgi:Holliday junction resolvasome RuvABC DNA-binding subunit
LERNQAIAYTTIAMNKLGYSRREIESITNKMLDEFEECEVTEAEDRADEILFREE